LQSRTVTGQSSIMAMAPDGASFMAGFTLYGTASLNVIAQQNIANAPFPMTGAFSTTTNLGGSVFTSDGKTLYSANGPSNDVSVVNLGNLTVTKKVKVGDSPWGIAVLQH